MPARPYVIVSCALSLDGAIDDAGGVRLLLSNEADSDRVDELRASCDAILVGATTLRRDNPRLLVTDDARRQARLARVLPEHPVKVTVTGGPLDPGLKFFTTGGPRLVYCPAAVAEAVRASVGDRATVIAAGDHRVDFPVMLADLAGCGIGRLMVDGGGTTTPSS